MDTTEHYPNKRHTSFHAFEVIIYLEWDWGHLVKCSTLSACCKEGFEALRQARHKAHCIQIEFHAFKDSILKGDPKNNTQIFHDELKNESP